MIDFGPLKYVLSVVVTAEETSSTLSLDSSSVSDERSLHGGNPRRGRCRRARSHPLRRWWRGRRCVRAGRARPWGGRDGPRRRTTFRDRRLLGRAGLGELSCRPARRGRLGHRRRRTVGADPAARGRRGPQPSVAAHRAPIGSASMTPAGTGGSSGGSTDGGPSISSLAVLSSALAAVLWLSQRLRHGEVRARQRVRHPQPRAARIARRSVAHARRSARGNSEPISNTRGEEHAPAIAPDPVRRVGRARGRGAVGRARALPQMEEGPIKPIRSKRWWSTTRPPRTHPLRSAAGNRTHRHRSRSAAVAAGPSRSRTRRTTPLRPGTRTSPTNRSPKAKPHRRSQSTAAQGDRARTISHSSATRPSSRPTRTCTTTSRTPTLRRRSGTAVVAGRSRSPTTSATRPRPGTATTRSKTSSRRRGRVRSPRVAMRRVPTRTSPLTCRTRPRNGPTLMSTTTSPTSTRRRRSVAVAVGRSISRTRRTTRLRRATTTSPTST